MKVGNKSWRTIWLEEEGASIGVIDQTQLPHKFVVRSLRNSNEVFDAIRTMVVRGAPLIGVAGAYGLMLALQSDPSNEGLLDAFDRLVSARPTAATLRWSLARVRERVSPLLPEERAEASKKEASLIADQDVAMCEAIGEHGLDILEKIAAKKNVGTKNQPLRVLTHCNAGWLATVDWGTALAPIYKAHRAGLNLHIWVDETRPRNQGASLTAFELGCEGIPHTVIVDNAGGHLMQHGQVDVVMVGTDRTTRCGDVCNKIGTYLKALAAYDNGIPFYVALPFSTIDWSTLDGVSEIPIENRSSFEVTCVNGFLLENQSKPLELATVQITPKGTKAFNPAFDVTPARLVTGLITDRGLVSANENSLKKMYGDLS